MRIDLTAELSSWVAAAIRDYREIAPSTHRNHAPWAHEHRALPLLIMWESTIGLRADGQLIEWSTEAEPGWERPVSRARRGNGALFQGAQSFRQLAPAVPERTQAAVDCPDCGETSVAAPFICGVCFGIRWVPADDAGV